MQTYTIELGDISKEDIATVGGKGANLGEMVSLGMPVPPGFVVAASAYRYFLSENKLEPKIRAVLTDLDVNDPTKLKDVSTHIQKLIKKSSIPQDLAEQIMNDYLKLGKHPKLKSFRLRLASLFKSGDVPVAVRSSATSEDSKEASFAGQNASFMDVSGEASVVEAVRNCWASLFEARSIFYRAQNRFDHFSSYIAVVVQVMVPSEVSGIMFSIDPVTNNRDRVVIEAIWGLGDYIVQGQITPDHYEVSKSDQRVIEQKMVPQKVMLVRNSGGGTKQISVPKSKINTQKLSPKQIQELALLSKKLEQHYYFPQDSEFAVYKDSVFLIQTRPITTVNNRVGSEISTVKVQTAEKKLELLLEGAPASPGIRSGPVQILKNAGEIAKIKPGDVLVASQTNPDYVPAMKKACAIVTDTGGRTSHAAIVSRELGIPAVVGTGSATKKLKNGNVITVNGTEGKVYKGGLKISFQEPKKGLTLKGETLLKTATKVYVNLAEPEEAKQMAARNCDGVGLLRAEFMLAGFGVHPKQAIVEHKQEEFIKKLAEGLATFAQAFYPRPVVYRATDFKTSEYRTLRGGEKFEPQEENPMIGFRGAYRYIVQPEVFRMEIEAIKTVREKNGFKNLWLMIPFCRTVAELQKAKDLVNENGLQRSPSFQLWMMCEIPSNVILLDKFIEVGIDGISVGSNDLTMLTLGVDRDNEHVASEYNELDESMLMSFEKIVKICLKAGITCSMCGQAPSDYPQLTEKLVEWGISSVSVNPDAIDHTRQIIYEAERKLVNR